MEKPTIKRSLIHTISRYSNWSSDSIDQFIRTQNIYADVKDWRDFIRLLLVGGGTAFLVSGIIFFFAFNWEDMHKFTKLGLVQGILALLVLASVFLNIDVRIKNILLTGASMLIGAVFAVFGQIYQTGADAYDLFLGWTVFIALWVIVSNFPPLWFIFLGLLNLTFWLFTDQVASDWSYHLVLNTLFLINIGSLLLLKWQESSAFVEKIPKWLERIIVMVSLGFLTMSVCAGIFDTDDNTLWIISILLILIAYAIGIWYGNKMKDTFYIAVVGLSIIMVSTALLIKVLGEFRDFGFLLIIGIFLIGSISFLVMQILTLNKKWHGRTTS